MELALLKRIGINSTQMFKFKPIYLIIVLFLNGCIQSSASILGPVYAVTKTGNVYHAGISFSVNQTVKLATGKSPGNHIELFFVDMNNKDEEIHFYKIYFDNKIKKIRSDHPAFLNSVISNIKKKN
jgi:hypothetical protein